MRETPIARLKRILREKISPTDGQIAVAIRRKEMEEKAFKVANDIVVEPTTVAGQSAEWLHAPGTRNEQSILYLHGGGYVLGRAFLNLSSQRAKRLTPRCHERWPYHERLSTPPGRGAQ